MKYIKSYLLALVMTIAAVSALPKKLDMPYYPRQLDERLDFPYHNDYLCKWWLPKFNDNGLATLKY